MAQPDSKPFTLQNPTELALAYGNDKNRLLQAVYAGLQGRGAPIDPTSALLAGRLIDESKNAKPPIQSVFAKTFAPPAPPAGLGATPQGMQMAGGPGPQMAAPPQMIPPAPQGPVRMAGGGLTTLSVPDDMYDEQSFAGGGIVAFADAGDVRTKRRKALMNIIRTAETSDQRMAARAALNKLEGMGAGAMPSRGLADALAYTRDDLPFRQPVSADASIYSPDSGEPRGTRLDPAEFNRNPSPSNLFGNAEAAQRGPQMPNLSGFGDTIMAANLREMDAARGTDASGGISLRSPELAAIDARSRAKNEAAGQVPFRGFGDTAGRMAAILGDAEINTYGNAEAAQRGPRTTGSINNLGELTRTLAAQFSPPPSDPTGLNALIASNNPNVRPASSAVPTSKEVPPPRGERGVVGGAPRAPRTTRAPATTERETTPTAGTDTPNAMTLEEIQKRIDEAGKLPEFQRTSAEELAARKNEDLWSALAQIGFGAAAGDSPYALTNIGKGAAAAMPGMQASLKERRADERDERNREFDYLTKKAGIKGDNFKSAYTIFSSMEDREQRAYLEKLRIQAQEKENRLNREVQRRGQDITAAGQEIYEKYYGDMTNKEQREFDFKAKVIADADNISMEKARKQLLLMEFARRTGSTNNTEDTLKRVNALGGRTGGKGGNMIDYGSLD